MSVDLVVCNGRLVAGDQVIEGGGVAVAAGTIVAVGATRGLPDAPSVVDVAGAWILPGVIDPHVHFRDPGLTDREDFDSGSTAAVIGGVATVFDMPNTVPPTADAARVRAKRAIVGPKARVDFGLFGLVGQDSVEAIPEMAAAGVIGFKFFLHQAVEGVPPCDDGALLEAFERIAETGLRAAVHAENPEIVARRSRALRDKGRHDAAANLEARPTVSESEMVERCIAFARAAGSKLHVCHVTSGETVRVVAAARAAGVDVTAETGPQWLTFTQDDVARRGTILMFSPPFRVDADREALWQGLRDGVIGMVATDHAPRHEHEKLCSSVWETKSGFIGIETSVPVMMTAVAAGRLDVRQYARAISDNAARAWGLWPRKGGLRVGADADVTVVRTGEAYTITPARLHSRARVTPFEGLTVSALATHTFLRGALVAEHGRAVGPPRGRDVRAG